jgi:hypothetical protein
MILATGLGTEVGHIFNKACRISGSNRCFIYKQSHYIYLLRTLNIFGNKIKCC